MPNYHSLAVEEACRRYQMSQMRLFKKAMEAQPMDYDESKLQADVNAYFATEEVPAYVRIYLLREIPDHRDHGDENG